MLSSSDLSRHLSKNDKILECCICNKEFLLIKYQPNGLSSTNLEDLEDGDSVEDPIYHYVIFRISKLAKLLKIDDSWEKMEEEDGVFEKHHTKLLAIIGRTSELEGSEYKGFLVKFYTYEGNNLYVNFWKLNKYGRFTNVKFKFRIAENLTSVCDFQHDLLQDIKQGFGYDYLWIKKGPSSSDSKVLRLVYDRDKLFQQTADIKKELDTQLLGEEEHAFIVQLKEQNRNQLLEELEEYNGIMDIDELSDWSEDSEGQNAELAV
jgi:hypothetical protein